MAEYFSFHHTVIGASHIDKGIECQDCSDSFRNSNATVMVVCDGHGGANYFRSSRGSKFGCHAFRQCITDEAFLESLTLDQFCAEQDARLRQLIMSVIFTWNRLVEEDIANDPFREEELVEVDSKYRESYLQGKRQECAYGTTLIGVVLTDKFWFGIHIGDGKCVVLGQDDQYTQPIPWDEKCFLNQTTSMCDSNVYEAFRYHFSTELPKAIFIASDGIDDCFASANEEKSNTWLHGFYNTVAIQFGTNPFEQAKEDLFAYLPTLSRKGSRDDMSIAGIVCLAQLAQRIPAQEAAAEDGAQSEPEAQTAEDSAQPEPEAQTAEDSAQPEPEAQTAEDSVQSEPEAQTAEDSAQPEPEAETAEDSAQTEIQEN